MEIRFSDKGWERVTPDPYVDTVHDAAGELGIATRMTSARGRSVRFTLPGSDEADHDRVIRALLTLDPDATVRTAKAIYNGKADFEKQRGK